IQFKYNDLMTQHQDLESNHGQKVESLETELKSTLERDAGEMTSQTEIREKEVAELQRAFEDTKVQLQNELEVSQSTRSAETDAEHNRAIESILGAQEEKLS